MTKTRLDVVQQSLRHLGVLAADDPATADMVAYVGGVLDALFEECKTVHGMAFSWTLNATPEAAFLPLARLLAAEVAQHYDQPSEPRERALMRLRAYAFPDDRPLRADYDDSGTVTEGEQEASDRAAFF